VHRKGDSVHELAYIIGFVLLGLTWLALRGMDGGKRNHRSRR
jgi:hypothetical protein